MRRETLNALVGISVLTGGAYLLSFLALTKGQKEYIRRRDPNCQAPVPHPCNTDPHDPIHHIINQGYAARFNINPDVRENVIRVCRNFHDMVHPDVPATRRRYHEDKKAFEQLHEERARKMDQREIYWDDTWDRPMTVRVMRQNQEYDKKAPNDKWPERRPKK